MLAVGLPASTIRQPCNFLSISSGYRWVGELRQLPFYAQTTPSQFEERDIISRASTSAVAAGIIYNAGLITLKLLHSEDHAKIKFTAINNVQGARFFELAGESQRRALQH
jgi:hypothetical protein